LAHPFTNQMDVLLIASCFSELWHSQSKAYKSNSRVYLYRTEHTLFIFSFSGSGQEGRCFQARQEHGDAWNVLS